MLMQDILGELLIGELEVFKAGLVNYSMKWVFYSV